MRITGFSFKKMNLNELAYDSALLVFPFLLAGIYDPVMRVSLSGIPFQIFFLLCTVYFLPVLMGKMYNVEYRDSSSWIKKSLIFIACSGTLFAYGSLLNMTINSVNTGENAKVLIFISGTVLLIMGPIAGIIAAPGNDTGGEISLQAGVFLFTIGVLPLFFILVSGGQIFGDVKGFMVFLIIFILMLADALFVALLYWLYVLCVRFIARLGISDEAGLAVRLLVPFCISFIMVFFNIYCDRVIPGGVQIDGGGPALLVLFFYFITGVIPLRIVMMLAPPVRPVNVIIGVFSASVMVYVIALK